MYISRSLISVYGRISHSPPSLFSIFHFHSYIIMIFRLINILLTDNSYSLAFPRRKEMCVWNICMLGNQPPMFYYLSLSIPFTKYIVETLPRRPLRLHCVRQNGGDWLVDAILCLFVFFFFIFAYSLPFFLLSFFFLHKFHLLLLLFVFVYYLIIWFFCCFFFFLCCLSVYFFKYRRPVPSIPPRNPQWMDKPHVPNRPY